MSIIGDDNAGEKIRAFCKTHRIDDDAIFPRDKSSTWRSIILVHGCENTKTGPAKTSRGQRVFLDMKSEWDVSRYSPTGYRQMKAMLGKKNKELKAVYVDKWLTDPAKTARDPRASRGFLSSARGLKILEDLAKRKDVDIVYESGSQGSRNLAVEKLLAPIVNVFTAAFPCFLNILKRGHMVREQDAKSCDEHRMLLKYKFASKQGANVLKPNGWVPVPLKWGPLADYLRKKALHRWFIVTLHESGALALDLSNSGKYQMRWFPGHAVAQSSVRNTTGAGDTFRGALLFGLIQPHTGGEINHLGHCVDFAVRCATERCRHYKMGDALTDFGKNGFDLWRKVKGSD